MTTRMKNELLMFGSLVSGIALVVTMLVMMGCTTMNIEKNIYNIVSEDGQATTTYFTFSTTDAELEDFGKTKVDLKGSLQ